jgi:hypothetical protein
MAKKMKLGAKRKAGPAPPPYKARAAKAKATRARNARVARAKAGPPYAGPPYAGLPPKPKAKKAK